MSVGLVVVGKAQALVCYMATSGTEEHIPRKQYL